jgi:hypothetical protein
MKTVYMAVTADKYELPVAIADTGFGLARLLGIHQNRVHEAMSKGVKWTMLSDGQRVKFVKVPIEDDE